MSLLRLPNVFPSFWSFTRSSPLLRLLVLFLYLFLLFGTFFYFFIIFFLKKKKILLFLEDSTEAEGGLKKSADIQGGEEVLFSFSFSPFRLIFGILHFHRKRRFEGSLGN